MRRSLTFTAAWLVAAAVATTAAWQGVGLVTNQVTDERPAALAADDVRDKLDQPTSTTAATPPATAPATTTSTAAPADAVTRTYNLEGGSAALRFTPAGVSVVWSAPNAGFGVKTEPEHGNGFRVEFESETHRSRVTGWWDGGPQDETREDPR